jgi:hypothetical protein
MARTGHVRARDTGAVTEGAGLRALVGELLDLVQRQSGFALVMLTRVVADDWRVLEVTANPYDVAPGDTFPWQDSICNRMAARDEPSPWVLPDAEADEDARTAPVRELLDITAYAGVPLRAADGSLMGTLCAIDPGPATAPDDLLRFAERFGSYVLAEEAAAAGHQRRAERRLLGASDGRAALVPKASWSVLLDAEGERTTWSGERLTISLLRVADHGTGRPLPMGQLAARLLDALGEDDAVAVLGTNRIGVLAVDRAWQDLDAAIDAVGQQLLAEGVRLRSVTGEVTGPATPLQVCDELEDVLVGAAATARSASERVRYEFCAACGRKGRYQRPATDLVRCKYCGASDLSR